MTFDEVKQKLVDNNLGNYIEVFEQNHLYDIDILQLMTNEDYISIGISIIGDRKKLLSILSKENSISNSQKIWNIEKDFGEKIYKEVIISGKKVQRWCTLGCIEKYDIDKNLIYSKVIDRVPTEVWNEYDSDGNVVITRWKEKDGSVSTHKTLYEYDSFGHVISRKDWNGETIYKYDKNGNKVYSKEEWFYGRFYEYDSDGRVIREYSDDERDENGNKDSEIWNEYDENGNLIHVIDINHGTKSEKWRSYNNNNKIISEKMFYHNNRHKNSKTVWNTIFEYDENGNCIYELEEGNDGWKNEIFYDYIKDGDVFIKYIYSTK